MDETIGCLWNKSALKIAGLGGETHSMVENGIDYEVEMLYNSEKLESSAGS